MEKRALQGGILTTDVLWRKANIMPNLEPTWNQLGTNLELTWNQLAYNLELIQP